MAAYAEDDKEIEELEACMDELRSAYEADKSSQHEVDEALRLSMKLADKRGSALRHAETLIGSVDLNAVAELKSNPSRAEAALADARKESVAQTRSSKKRDAVIAKKLKHLTEELSAAKKRRMLRKLQRLPRKFRKPMPAPPVPSQRWIFCFEKRLKRQKFTHCCARSSA